MIRRDHQNHTDAEVEQALVKALALVDTLRPPDDLRGPFFVKAVELLAGKQITWEQPQPVDLARLGIRHN